MGDYTQYDEYTRKGTKAVEHFLNENRDLRFKALKEKLRKLGIVLKDQTIRNYMSNWRVYSQNGLVPQSHSGLGHLWVGFGVGMWETALALGWVRSKNRNRCRRCCKLGITLFWYRDGIVQFRFKGSRSEADLLAAFSQAFWPVLRGAGNSEIRLADFLKVVFKSRYRRGPVHRTFDVGEPLPRFSIKYYEKSRGLIIKTDHSHPTALEIEEREPPWCKRLDVASDKISNAAELFAENIKTHLEVPKAMTEAVQELKTESLKRQEALERISGPHREQDSFFVDNWIWIVEKLDFPVKGWCGRCHERDRLLYYVEDRYGYSSIVCEDCGSLLKRLIDGRP